jgi:putative restriction endonuclease
VTGAADPDAMIRLAAFDRLRQLSTIHGGPLSWSAILEGFTFQGRHFHFASRAEGIFKPKEMSGVLSLKTVVPKPTRRVWYDDQKSGDDRVRSPSDVLPYSFSGTDSAAARNQWLRDAMIRGFPLVYFYGVAPGMYEPLFPIFVVGWESDSLSVSLALSAAADNRTTLAAPPDAAERRYAMRQAKQRLHQAMFREQVVDAYGGRCAMSNLPELRLLDAAHIVPDGHNALGQPDVRNGILMSRIHHSAYDCGLIAIDPDYRIHVADSLLVQHDGPLLEGIKRLKGILIRVPKDPRFQPDRDRLSLRFSEFDQAR